MKKQVMKKAWEIATVQSLLTKASKKSLLSIALKEAWALVKAAAYFATPKEVSRPVDAKKNRLAVVRGGSNRTGSAIPKRPGATIPAPNTTKCWCAEIKGSDLRYRLDREFIKADTKNEVFHVENGKYYEVSHNNISAFVYIANNEYKVIAEEVVMQHFSAPTRGLNDKQYQEFLAFKKAAGCTM